MAPYEPADIAALIRQSRRKLDRIRRDQEATRVRVERTLRGIRNTKELFARAAEMERGRCDMKVRADLVRLAAIPSHRGTGDIAPDANSRRMPIPGHARALTTV